MLVCHCKAVNEAGLREIIETGARDEFDVAEACGAGSVCGGCVPTISRLLDECHGCPLVDARDAVAGGRVTWTPTAARP